MCDHVETDSFATLILNLPGRKLALTPCRCSEDASLKVGPLHRGRFENTAKFIADQRLLVPNLQNTVSLHTVAGPISHLHNIDAN